MLVFLIEKMKSRPEEWRTRNEAAMKRGGERPNVRICEAMLSAKEPVIQKIVAYLRAPERNAEFGHYRTMGADELEWYIGVVYRLLMAGVRTGDRTLLLQYADDLAHRLFAGGFAPAEISGALLAMTRFVVADLLARPELRDLEQQIHDSLTLTVQLAVDEIEDYYDWFVRQTHPVPGLLVEGIAPSARGEDLERPIAQLDAFYEPPLEREAPPGSGEQKE